MLAAVSFLTMNCVHKHQQLLAKSRKLSYRKDDCAMHPIYGCPKNCWVPEYVHGYFFRNFKWAFVVTDPMNVRTIFFEFASVKTYVWTRTPGRTSYHPATTSSFSVIQLISIEITLHGEESTLTSEVGVSGRRNVKFLTIRLEKYFINY